ncbi:carbohydrate-binding module 1 protein [Ceratobasidium sp. 370]|nr:carbohydrate-binding module 1 protein [Ceratobasidium sp. 370]
MATAVNHVIPSAMPPSPPSSPPHLTNTLIVPNLPPSFFDPLVLQALRDLFTSYGQLHSWAPLRGLGRIILVYWNERHAEDAKLGTDGLNLGVDLQSPPLVLRVFRGAPTPTQAPQPATLAVPALEKNFLISPPGSPPVGWEPVVEDPPNRDALASDLMDALRRLELSRQGGVEVLVSEGEGGVPAVHLEGEWTEDEQIARGGSGITMVKATVASMGGSNSGIATPLGSGWMDGERVPVQRIPTARPPLPNEST